jgi:hypothetical protein
MPPVCRLASTSSTGRYLCSATLNSHSMSRTAGLALVRLLVPVPAVECAAAGGPRDRAAAGSRRALEHPLSPLPPRHRDPRRPAGPQAIRRGGHRPVGDGDSPGIRPAPRQGGRRRGGRDHRQRPPVPAHVVRRAVAAACLGISPAGCPATTSAPRQPGSSWYTAPSAGPRSCGAPRAARQAGQRIFCHSL